MIRRSLIVLLVTATGLSTGCMKMHLETVIDQDGSGTTTLTYAMSTEVAAAFSKMDAAGGSGLEGGPPALSEMSREQMEEICRQAGIKLVSHDYQDDGKNVSLTMKLGFSDLASLSRAMNVINGSAAGSEQEMLAIESTGDGNYVLRTVKVPGAAADENDEDLEEALADMSDMADMQESMAAMSTLMAHLGDLDVRMAITVPGDVIHSNAMEVEGRTSIWTINAANMMQAEGLDMSPEIRFSGQGLKLRPTTP
jgi:sugar phosphate isomerase/epimerase